MTFVLTRPKRHIRRRRISLFAYLDLYRQRRALSKLDPHMLRDIGLTQAEAKNEVRRPIWHAPDHWKC